MRRVALGLMLATFVVGPAMGQAPSAESLTPDQKGYIAYDQCMMYAAMRVSHTDARDEDVFSLAKAQCAATRSSVIKGQESNREFLAALDAADADKSAKFPGWIMGVRERRKAFEAQADAPRP